MAQIHRTLWFRFLLLTLLSSMAAAQLPVAEDTFVASGTTTPSGTNTNLQVIASPINAALVRFDLSGVPAGTTGNQVTKATVKLYVNTVSLSGSLDVCQVTSPWTEASTVFTSKPTLSATPLATAVPVSTASKYIVVDITPAVQAWQNGTANNGIALLPSSATPCNSSTYGTPNTSINVKFDSKENISASHDAGLNVVLSLTNGTVTSVGTGQGLTGGPITTSGTISIVPPSGNVALGGVKGPNASGTCAAGSHFSGIAMDGTLTCTADSVTSINFSAITSGTNTGQALTVGSGSSLNPSGGTITANMLSAGTYGPGVNISGNAGTVTNGLYTTGSYADPSWITSLSGAKISGSVASALFASSAGTTTNFTGALSGDVTGTQSATVVSAIGGAAPSLFARRDQANTFTATQALAPQGNTSQPSNLLQLNATDASSHSLSAQLQALNDGSLSFQFGPTGSAVQKLFIDNTGKITFASGQTFPGTQSLTAGTGIAINSNAIDNTGVLSFNGRNGSVTSTAGDYSFSQISGAISSGQAAPGLYAIDISGNANTANTAGSAGTAGTAGDASNLGGVPAASYARRDTANSFTGDQTVAGFVNATSSTGDAVVGTSTGGNAGVSGHGANGVVGTANGSVGSIGVRGDAAVVDGNIHFGVKGTAADPNSIAGVFDSTGAGTAKVLSGQKNGTEVFSVAANGDVTGNKFTGDGSGLTNVSAGTFTGSITESQVTNLTSDLATKLTAASPLNAANLTGTVPTANLSGTYGINISGSAASALTAGSATTAGDASNLGGQPASNYARLDIGNAFTGDQTVAGFVNATSSTGDALVGTSANNTGVSGHGGNGVAGIANGTNGSIGVRGDASVVDGLVHYGVEAVAADTNSIAGVFDHTGGGKILSGRNNGNEVFSVDGNGKVSGDGSGLTNVTAGTFTGTINGSQVSGNISGNAASITGTVNGSQVVGNISGNAASITGTINGGQVSGSVASAATAGFATSAGDASNLGGVAAANYARRDTDNTFTGFLNATSSTGDAIVGTSTGGNSGVSGSGANGVVGTANGSVGSIGVRGDAAVVDGNIHFGVKGTAADPNSIAGVFDSTGAGTAKILSGQKNGTEVFSVDANGKITGDGSGLTNVSAGTFTGNITESQVTNLTSDLASKLTAASPLNAANLTGIVPSANLSGTYAISISGNAASALTAGSATTAGDASNLGGQPASNYARLDIGNSFTGDQTVAGFVNATSSTGDAVVGTSTGGNAGVSGHGANGVVGTANGSVGSIGVRGDAAVVDGNIHFGVKGTAADPNSIAGVFDSTGAGTAKVLSGQKNGTEVFSVAANGDVTGNKFTGDGSGLTNVAASTFTNSIPESQVTNLTSDLASKLTAASPLNAANLTGTVPSASLSGTYNISINGSAASAGTAGTAGSATNFSGGLVGDVTGGQSTTTVAKIAGTQLGTLSGATNGQTLTWNGSAWVPATPAATGAPAILSGFCTGAATVSTLGFAGLGGPAAAQTSEACADTMTVGTAIGIPMTSGGTLKNLRVYPGTLANGSTSVAFTVYVAAAPGWTVASTSNPNTASSGATSGSGAIAPGTLTVTITTTNHFTNGDTVNVQLNSQTLNCSGSGGNSFNATALNGNRTLTAASSTSFSFAVSPSPCTAGNGNIMGTPTTSGTISDLTNPTFTTTTSSRTTPTATALTCTIGAPTTSAAAVCSDASNTVSVSAGDLVSVIGTGGKAGETLGDIRVSLEKQ